MQYTTLPFSREVFFMNAFRYWLCSLSCGFTGFSDTTVKFLACSSFGFSIARSCFSLPWAAFAILVQASSHRWPGRDVVWMFVSLLPDHKNPVGGVSFNSVNLVKTCPRIWQISTSVDIPVVINSFFLCHIQIGVSWRDDINVFQWNREWFFFRHIEMNSRFNMMTINKVSLNRPKVFPIFSVIFLFFKSKLFPIALRHSAKSLSPYGEFPSQSGFLEFVVSLWQFCCIICHRKHKFSVCVGYQDFLCIRSSGIHFWCVQLF